jgi:hypothetical protein
MSRPRVVKLCVAVLSVHLILKVGLGLYGWPDGYWQSILDLHFLPKVLLSLVDGNGIGVLDFTLACLVEATLIFLVWRGVPITTRMVQIMGPVTGAIAIWLELQLSVNLDQSRIRDVFWPLHLEDLPGLVITVAYGVSLIAVSRYLQHPDAERWVSAHRARFGSWNSLLISLSSALAFIGYVFLVSTPLGDHVERPFLVGVVLLLLAGLAAGAALTRSNRPMAPSPAD